MRDANGQTLAYVYFEDEAGRHAAAKLLSHDEAPRTVVTLIRVHAGMIRRRVHSSVEAGFPHLQPLLPY